ncbi:hypothetical protein Lfu02_39960 [Longispora fulva]|uniref:Uncharacterized protein n=1 Tax=Longispora fulva TaxID=619741 RepID=A0A8J7KWE4_9ACTN|nr:hypothetical protein [Longispora fulva]GIG59624.1 hypothetical protein Lfu02_39960 [Longispora fulva]
MGLGSTFLVSDGGQAEVDGSALVEPTVEVCELVLGAGEADLESFDLAEPAFAFDFGGAC